MQQFMCKYWHNLVPNPFDNYFILIHKIHHHNTRHSCNYLEMPVYSGIFFSKYAHPSDAKIAGKYAEFNVEICSKGLCIIQSVLANPVFNFAITSVNVVKKVKLCPDHKAHRAALISVSLALSQRPAYNIPYTARPRIGG